MNFKKFLEEKVWEKPMPEASRKGKLSPSQKAKAKARARAAGRPYPNMVDNMRASRTEEKINLPRLGSNPGKFKRLVARHLGAKAAEKIGGSDGSRIMAKAKKTGNTSLYRQGSFIKNFYEEKKAGHGKPFRTPGGPKKFAVYVKSETGNTKKVTFGDPNLSIKRDNPERRKSFRARHNCDNPGPRTKARYWSCRQWRAGAKVEA